MTIEQKARKKIKDKGWKIIGLQFEPVTYGRDGRDGGWQIDIETEYEEDNEDYFRLFNEANVSLPILAYNAKDLMAEINKIPTRPKLLTP